MKKGRIGKILPLLEILEILYWYEITLWHNLPVRLKVTVAAG